MCLCMQDLRFTPRAGLEQSNERTTKQSEQLDHRATASPDSHRFASYMEFPTGTTRPSTTLADLFTLRFRADPPSAVRASLRRTLSDKFDDGAAHGWQAWLRWWSVDSFFPASLF